jgi:hypothetical protein
VLTEAVRTGPIVVVTTGESMAPHLGAGRSVRIEKGDIGFGDVAAFVNRQGEVVVHRHVVSMFGRSLFLGDGNPRFDPFVMPEDILGRVVAIDDGPEPERHRVFLVRRTLRLLPREARAYLRRRRNR